MEQEPRVSGSLEGDGDEAGFPPGFFRRTDEAPDAQFYGPRRLVTHIDDRAIAAVGRLYAHLGIDGGAPSPAGCSTSCRRGCRTSPHLLPSWSRWA